MTEGATLTETGERLHFVYLRILKKESMHFEVPRYLKDTEIDHDG